MIRFFKIRRIPRSRRSHLVLQVEKCEARDLPSSGLIAHHAVASHPVAAHVAAQPAPVNPPTFSQVLSRYRTFEGSIPIGKGRTLDLKGPILLGPTDARGQVVGYLYLQDGSRAAVVGLLSFGGVSLQISMADGRVLHAGGQGVLRKVVGGFPGYYTLLGRGDLIPTKGRTVFGGWKTVPSGT